MHDRGRRIERQRGAVALCFFITIISVFGLLSSGAWAFNVTLGWDPNAESDLAGYRIYYDTDSGPPYRQSINVPLSTPNFNRSSPEYTLTGLVDGYVYYFALTAYNGSGLESGYSNEVSTGTTPSNLPPLLSSLEVNGESGSTAVYINDPYGKSYQGGRKR